MIEFGFGGGLLEGKAMRMKGWMSGRLSVLPGWVVINSLMLAAGWELAWLNSPVSIRLQALTAGATKRPVVASKRMAQIIVGFGL